MSASAPVSDPRAAPSAAPRRRRAVVVLKDIVKVYGAGDIAVRALQGVTLTVEQGEFVAIMGASGSGKSTLMNIIGCLDIATAGSYHLAGVDVLSLDEYQLAQVRNRQIGFVFQSFNLIPRTSALANVELPLVYAGVRKAARRQRALEALESVGLADRQHHNPAQLSGGQQQRVAIARAIVSQPALILADEPTGALDSASSDEVLKIFERLSSEGRTVVMITHEPDVAQHAQRMVRVKDGRIVEDRRRVAAS